MDAISEAGTIELVAGDLSLGLAPAIGGSVAYLRLGKADLMRPLSGQDAAAGSVLGVAMFPMVPYANRIAGNAFAFGGRTWRFSANNPPERFNVHGTGWHLPWAAELLPGDARLSLTHIAPEEPYSYEASQLFALTPEGLRVTMKLTNLGSVAMPFGFGLHPWFIRDPDVDLRFSASHFFMEGPEGVATERLATPPELDFSAARRLPGSWRNNDYGGWRGTAEIRWPSRKVGLRMTADPIFAHLMLYADPEKPYFCVEPQSNAPTAFNRLAGGDVDGLGITILDPGEAMQGAVAFAPLALSE